MSQLRLPVWLTIAYIVFVKIEGRENYILLETLHTHWKLDESLILRNVY